jgi:hypothetical protein
VQAIFVLHGQVRNCGLLSALDYVEPDDYAHAVDGFAYAIYNSPPAGSGPTTEAPRPGFEPGAYSLGGSRSIQLSYRGVRGDAGIVVRASKRTARYA